MMDEGRERLDSLLDPYFPGAGKTVWIEAAHCHGNKHMSDTEAPIEPPEDDEDEDGEGQPQGRPGDDDDGRTGGGPPPVKP
jgi:hypothetical protein